MTGRGLSEQDFSNLLAFHTMLRRFERWSARQAKAVGLRPAQHQLLLAVKGHPDRRGPTIRDLADYLLLRHHSTVELVNRVEAAGLVRRHRDPDDARVARVALTTDGQDRLAQLVGVHLAELHRLAPILDHLVEESRTLDDGDGGSTGGDGGDGSCGSDHGTDEGCDEGADSARRAAQPNPDEL